ncbi:MAG TPA: penicillin acylase family protein, partial [Steroidobacteraceae bacterium]
MPLKVTARFKTTRKAIRIARCYRLGGSQTMKLLVVALLCIPAAVGAAGTAPGEQARWRQHAQQVRIIRDNWGIAHIYGKSDADAVFGMIYAQAEDDLNRIERNYLISLGWLAQAEG